MSLPSKHPKRFCFTYAITGGAWLEWETEASRGWFSFTQIDKAYGEHWTRRQLSNQGWMTGCWIDCINPVATESEAA